MRLFIDDLRDAPTKDWVVARTCREAISFLYHFGADEVSLDHDNTNPDDEDFIMVAYVIAMMHPDRQPKLLHVHSGNNQAFDNIKAILKQTSIVVTDR